MFAYLVGIAVILYVFAWLIVPAAAGMLQARRAYPTYYRSGVYYSGEKYEPVYLRDWHASPGNAVSVRYKDRPREYPGHLTPVGEEVEAWRIPA